MADDGSDSLIEYPSEFPLKVVGYAEDDFEDAIRGLIEPFSGTLPAAAITRNESRNARFVSLTITIVAQSREQLDSIYEALSESPRVLFSL